MKAIIIILITFAFSGCLFDAKYSNEVNAHKYDKWAVSKNDNITPKSRNNSSKRKTQDDLKEKYNSIKSQYSFKNTKRKNNDKIVLTGSTVMFCYDYRRKKITKIPGDFLAKVSVE